MVQAMQVFKTSDGEVFESEQEAARHEASIQHKAKIEDFINRHFPIPAPELVVNEDGTPKLNEKGEQEKKPKQNAGRGPARKALELWLAENA
jgi:hypothetical protein